MIKIIKCLVPKYQHHFVATSMGIDSVAALIWMCSKKYNITPIHFNHGLRPQNDIMQNKFYELCEKLKLKGVSSKGQAGSTESECRSARLNFYKNVVKNENIITAHHLNDWVESYLLNCFRGKPNHNPFELASDFQSFKIIHPFLLTRKKDFMEYLERNNYLCYTVVDESNFETKGSRRNWIRQQIIPEMSKNKLSLEKFAKRSINNLLERVK